MEDKDKNIDDYEFFDDENDDLNLDDICIDLEEDDSFFEPIDEYEHKAETFGPPKPNIPLKRLIEGLTLDNANFENRTFGSFVLSHAFFYNVIFKKCTLENIDCQNSRFIACKFENCEIKSFSGEGYVFRQCEFTDCKFGGVEYIDDCFSYSGCEFTNCTFDYDE